MEGAPFAFSLYPTEKVIGVKELARSSLNGGSTAKMTNWDSGQNISFESVNTPLFTYRLFKETRKQSFRKGLDPLVMTSSSGKSTPTQTFS